MTFSFGTIYKIRVFGESHGTCIGAVVEGCPPGITIDTGRIQAELDRRRPGRNILTTQRKEGDVMQLLSGVLDGVSTGAPITMIIRNEDVDSSAYKNIEVTPRPGHADLMATIKYKGHNDLRGGGIFSGRMTAAFVMAGALAKQVLDGKGIKVLSHIVQIGNVKAKEGIEDQKIEGIDQDAIHCADAGAASLMEKEVYGAMSDSDSIGACIECRIIGMPPGVGEPMFDSVESVISHAMFSIPAVKGVEFGSGFQSASMKGSENNDPFIFKNGKIITKSNNAGGVLGGISTGMPIVFKVAIKPTPSIGKRQKTVDMKTKKETIIEMSGRHDPCIGIRAVPVIENMAAICALDLLMRSGL